MPTYVVPLYVEVHCPGENKADAARRAVDAVTVASERRVLHVFDSAVSAGPMLEPDGEHPVSLLVWSVLELNDALRVGHLRLVVEP